MTEKKLTDEELKQVTGGANADGNDSIVWKFLENQILYGHALTPQGAPVWTVKITIKNRIVINGKPGYRVHIYDQVIGPRDLEWTEAYLLGEEGNFELE